MHKYEQVTLIFPHQLFKVHPAVKKERPVYLLEDELYFRQYNFHKKKLILHRASMKFYQSYIKANSGEVEYIDTHNRLSSLKTLFEYFKNEKIKEVHYCNTTDYLLERRLKRYAAANSIYLDKYDTPYFLNSEKNIEEYFGQKNHYFLHDFYVHERKRLSVLITGSGKPTGEKWSFDAENRKKLPKGLVASPITKISNNPEVKEAYNYIQKTFSKNLGYLDKFNYPVNFNEQKQGWMIFYIIVLICSALIKTPCRPMNLSFFIQ
jgi:deoxyribodipyrimidine photolyase-related protein